MTATNTRAIQRAFSPAIGFVGVLIAALFVAPRAAIAVLPLGDEQDSWSDMLLSSANGTFDSGTFTMGVNVAPADLEIGSQFGPSNPGSHYGTSGTLGGTFSASLLISRLQIAPNGAVVSGNNSIVTLSYGGGTAGSLGTDYGIGIGRALVRGIVLEVLLDATGDDTLDILYSITGGDLQELPNQQAPLFGKFATGNLGLFRFTAASLPSNWTSNFSFTASSLHAFGFVPEPGTCLLACLAVLSISLARSPRDR